MLIRGSTSYATLFGYQSYVLLWEQQTLRLRAQHLPSGIVGAEQQISDARGVFSVRPFFRKKELKKPKTRRECYGVPRPCPFVTCVWNTFLDVQADGSIVFNWKNCEPEDMEPWGSCVLDIADDGGIPDERIGQVLGLTSKEVGGVCEGALRKLRHYDIADLLGIFRMRT